MIGAIVLAAGFSTRMGRPKASLPLGDGTFLGRILATLDAAGIEVVRVVLGGDAEAIAGEHGLAPPRLVVNPRPQDGMLSSARAGVLSLPDGLEAFLLWPVDHPLVRADTVRAIVVAAATGRSPVVVPSHAGKRGHPVLFAERLRTEILAAPDAVGARAVVRAHGTESVEVAVDDPGTIDDADTPDDYARIAGRPLS